MKDKRIAVGPLRGKTAVVTGGSHGLGRAVSEHLARLGASIAVQFFSSGQAAIACVDAIHVVGGAATAFKADLTAVNQIRNLFTAVHDQYGSVDIVVALVGLDLPETAMVEVTEAQFDRAFALATKGTFFTLQHAARNLSSGGRIIVISPDTANPPTAGHALAGGSTIAPRFFVEVLADELQPQQITVNSIHPPRITEADTWLWARHSPESTGAASLGALLDALEHLTGPSAAHITGTHLSPDGRAPDADRPRPPSEPRDRSDRPQNPDQLIS